MNKRNYRGFTLVEMLAAMIIAVVVSSLTYQIIGNMAEIYRYISARNKLTSTIRQVNDRLIFEMRQAVSITSATSQAFEFTTPGGNTVRYEISGNQLLRQLNGGTSRVLIPAINLNSTGSGFAYFNSSLDAETDTGLITSLTVTLNLVAGSETYVLVQNIFLENRRGV
jgi:prepilin-type N-terminal cleavage/methylation domain-containing protein